MPSAHRILHAIEANDKPEGDDSFVRRQIVLRLPLAVLSKVDALARMTGKSRNEMACELMHGGVESVAAEMTEDMLHAFADIENECFTELVG